MNVSLASQLLASPFPGTKRYRVQSGDTYEKIALRFWKSTKPVAELQRLNPDVDPRRMGTGMELVLPDLPIVEGSAPAAKPKTAAAEAPAGPGETYTVETGDTLIAIARRRYNDQRLWKLIHEANRALLPDPATTLRKGMKLRLPPAPAKK
jgi:nucleoid-associated protein YgaU